MRVYICLMHYTNFCHRAVGQFGQLRRLIKNKMFVIKIKIFVTSRLPEHFWGYHSSEVKLWLITLLK